MQSKRSDAIRVDHDAKYLRLWVVELADRRIPLVTRQDLEISDFDWSPDGTAFAVAASGVPGPAPEAVDRLAIVQRASGDVVKELTDRVYTWRGNPYTSDIRWSRDGRRAPSIPRRRSTKGTSFTGG